MSSIVVCAARTRCALLPLLVLVGVFALTASAAPASASINVNFQPAGTAPAGYLADTGQTYGDRGNGYSYGWDATMASNSRNRNSANSPDERYDTLITLEYAPSRVWEIAVPNGTYSVHLVAGDPSYFDSTYKFNLEGTLVLNEVASSGDRWAENTVNVNVADGKLTLAGASGAVKNKIDFIDITPAGPTVTITSPTEGQITSGDVPVSFTTTGTGVTTTCAIDGGAPSSCSSPKTYTGLAGGTHQVIVNATDTYGAAASAVRNFTVDTTPPAAPSITAPAASSSTNDTTPTVSGSAEADATVAVKEGATTLCTTTASGTGTWSCDSSTLTQGSHTIAATATDAAGNTSAASASRTFTVDTGGVPIKINFQPPPPVAVPSGYLVDSGEVYGDRGNGQFYGWSASASAYTRDRNATADQRYDTLLTMEYSPGLIWELAVPNGSYLVHLVAGDPSYFNSTNKFNVEGTLAINEVASSNDPWAENTVTVTVNDGKLTVSGASGAVNNKIDFIEVTPSGASAPTVTITAPTEGQAMPDGNVSVSFTTTGIGVTTTCAIDGGAPTGCTSPKAYTALTSGAHQVIVTATDSGGATATAVRNFSVTGAPSLTATSVDWSHIDVAWSNPPAGWATARILRSESSGGPYQQVGDTQNTAAGFRDAQLWKQTTYYYKVDFLNGAGGVIQTLGPESATTGAIPLVGGITTVPIYYPNSPHFATANAQSAALDPQSASLVNQLVDAASNGVVFAVRQYAVPIFEAHTTDRSISGFACIVEDENKSTGCSIDSRGPVKYPFDFHYDLNSARDEHATVYDPVGGTFWDFYKPRLGTVGNWNIQSWTAIPAGGGAVTNACPGAPPCPRTQGGQAYAASGTGIRAANDYPTNAAGLSNALGIVRPEEIWQGHIDHALVIGVPGLKAGSRCPAGSSASIAPQIVSAGTRLRLKSPLTNPSTGGTYDPSSLPAWTQHVITALQSYGAYVRDNAGGSISIFGELSSAEVFAQGDTIPGPNGQTGTHTRAAGGRHYDAWLKAGVPTGDSVGLWTGLGLTPAWWKANLQVVNAPC